VRRRPPPACARAPAARASARAATPGTAARRGGPRARATPGPSGASAPGGHIPTSNMQPSDGTIRHVSTPPRVTPCSLSPATSSVSRPRTPSSPATGSNASISASHHVTKLRFGVHSTCGGRTRRGSARARPRPCGSPAARARPSRPSPGLTTICSSTWIGDGMPGLGVLPEHPRDHVLAAQRLVHGPLDLAAQRREHPVLVDDQQPARLAHARQHGVHVGRHDRAQVDQLAVDPRLRRASRPPRCRTACSGPT
jgi:hypothetical protein